MAIPTNAYYSGASGQTIYGGKFPDTPALPDWVPAAGIIANVSLNTLNDVRGADDFSQTAAILRAWSGCAFAMDYGTYGSLIFTGTGHTDGALNADYRYDIATRLFSKIKPSATVPSGFTTTDIIGDSATGWMWADVTKTSLQVGEPCPSHCYAGLVGVPKTALAGSANGWVFLLGLEGMSWNGQGTSAQGLKAALPAEGQNVTWSHAGTPLYLPTSYGGSCYDSLRNRVVSFSGYANADRFNFVDLDTETTGSTNYTNGSVISYYRCAYYDAASDLYINIQIETPFTFKLISAAGVITVPTVSGTPPNASGGWDWIESWGCLVFYPGSGSTVWFLKRPANPLTGTWVWSSQTLTGITPVAQENSAHYSRFRFVPELGICLWTATSTSNVAAFGIVQP